MEAMRIAAWFFSVTTSLRTADKAQRDPIYWFARRYQAVEIRDLDADTSRLIIWRQRGAPDREILSTQAELAA
jgi:hypothetical protein